MNDEPVDDEQLIERTRSSLHVLTRRTPVAIGWRPADTVRRTALIRRRRRWGISAGVVIVVAVATALGLTSGPGGGVAPQARSTGGVHTGARIGSAVQLVADTSPVTTADPRAVDQVVAAEQRLSLALLDKVGGGSNVSVSPASLYLALGMLDNGARGSTASQISQAMQAGGLSTARQNAGLAALMADLDAAAAKDGIAFDSANSLWQQRGFEVRAHFLRTLAAYYRAGVWQVDYQHDMAGALQAINRWTSDKTRGRITKLFDPGSLDPATTVLVLANAIYYRASWQTPFDEQRTEPGRFTAADGKQVTAKFMSGGPGLRAAATHTYDAVELPYTGGRFAALAVMPTKQSLPDFVASLTPPELDSIASGLHAGLSVSLPRFTTTSTIDLEPVLSSLGMAAAFSDEADFSGLSATPTRIEKAVQRVYLNVGEKGTTAAAVTGLGIQIESLSYPKVLLDHPFLFLVRDTRTGAILFASEVQDPSAS